eukprot:8286780-Pyramimonas_sp.AAC.1
MDARSCWTSRPCTSTSCSRPNCDFTMMSRKESPLSSGPSLCKGTAQLPHPGCWSKGKAPGS